MDIRRLEAFCKVYELGSFSKAGQDLFLSQPTISAHVSSLEEELGVQLFDRLGRMILPTLAGKVLFRYAKEAFLSLENAKAEIQLLQDKISGDLVIGGSTIPAHYILPRVLADFTKRYPDVHVDLRVGDTVSVVDMVTRGDLILGVVGAELDRPELEFIPLKDDQLVIVASPNLNRPIGKTLGTKEICTWPWVMRERGSGTRKAFEKGLLAIGLDIRCLNISLTVESTEAVLQCVLSGFGVGITSRIAAQAYIDRGELLELNAPSLAIRRRFYLIRHEKRHIFPVTRYFIDFLMNACR
ncbi:transcriptional regulator, LysR family [Desulfocurvibacter africanus PCS]|uniref:Transcriptional regulator, LysR family n=1 Tax=Desulfocurvibacter africanus PCS TaxID=1262666 RepID=M5PW13_DESAF|nr:selenium metabolism-associated LysR family transcriptional regulator [Desulfocurvibacter africanus]EMG38259.1 transcriptional regulator, LysR family [Desulfocurvibacter africanus PCS]